MALTKAEALRLFNGYPNYSSLVMREFIDLFFNTFNNGNLDVPEPKQIRFYNSSKTVLHSFMQQNGATTFWNTNAAGDNIQVFAHNIATFRGAATTLIGSNGGALGFFTPGNTAAQQTVAKDVFAVPTDLPSAIVEIEKLQTVVESLRNGILAYSLFN